MGRSQETFHKKEVRNRKEKKRKEKEKKRIARKENQKKSNLDDMIAYVDENGMITSSPPDTDKKTEAKLEDIQISPPKRDSLLPSDLVREGTVIYFDESKGYGFIRDSKDDEKIFVHANNLLEEVKVGDEVNYEIEMSKKGLVALQVKLKK